MKRRTVHTIPAMLAVALLLMTMLSGCGRKNNAAAPADTAAPVSTAGPVASAEPVTPAEPAAPSGPDELPEPGRQDGERFEEVIILEGIEETVSYEHIINGGIGVEMDYDYERFIRSSSPDREFFVSCWDLPDVPENYLEVTYSPLDADTAAASVRASLSQD